MIDAYFLLFAIDRILDLTTDINFNYGNAYRNEILSQLLKLRQSRLEAVLRFILLNHFLKRISEWRFKRDQVLIQLFKVTY